MNISLHITWATIPFKFIVGNNWSHKTICSRLSPTIRANIQLRSVWLQNVSGGWPMQAVARLEICTMQINIVLHYCTLLLISPSNPVTRPTVYRSIWHTLLKVHFGTHCPFGTHIPAPWSSLTHTSATRSAPPSRSCGAWRASRYYLYDLFC